jgi:hypothetical protein
MDSPLLDYAVGHLLAAMLRRHSADDDGEGNRGGKRAGSERDRAVEPRHLLKSVEDPQHELRSQPERERAHDAIATPQLL